MIDSGKATSWGVMVSGEASLEYAFKILGESKTLPEINSFKCLVILPILLMIIP